MNVLTILAISEPTHSELGVWLACAAVAVVGLLGLMKLGEEMEKRFSTRKEYEALRNRVDLIEAQKRDEVREAVLASRYDKHMNLMQKFIEAQEREVDERVRKTQSLTD